METKIYTDQLGRRVKIPFPPRRIVSLVPSQTELLYHLGANVVGITKFCIHPSEWFRTKTRVGGTKQLHPDIIRSLSPDLIIANKEENDAVQVEALMQEFPVWVSDIKTLEDALEMILAVGNITNLTQQALALNTQITANFHSLLSFHSHPNFSENKGFRKTDSESTDQQPNNDHPGNHLLNNNCPDNNYPPDVSENKGFRKTDSESTDQQPNNDHPTNHLLTNNNCPDNNYPPDFSENKGFRKTDSESTDQQPNNDHPGNHLLNNNCPDNNYPPDFSENKSFGKLIKAAYFIWKDPWMVAGGDTFISEMMKAGGFQNIFADTPRYPEVKPEELKGKDCQLVLLSSEPYPFKEKHIAELQLILPDAKILLVDGEMYSWYGSRLLHSPAYFHSLLPLITP